MECFQQSILDYFATELRYEPLEEPQNLLEPDIFIGICSSVFKLISRIIQCKQDLGKQWQQVRHERDRLSEQQETTMQQMNKSKHKAMVMANIKDHSDHIDQTRRDLETKYADAVERIRKTIFKLS
jgi:hypothetical protein